MRELPVRSLLIALLVPLVAVFAGCNLAGSSGDENPDDGAGSGAVSDSDNGIALGIASTPLDMLEAMFDAVDVVSEPAGLRTATVSYDDGLGVWTISDSFEYDVPDADGAAQWTCEVQFLVNGVPQRYPDDTTTHLNAEVTAGHAGNYHPQGKSWNVDFDWTTSAELHAAVNGDMVDITGGGNLNGTSQTHIGSMSLDRTRTATWTYALSMPREGGGCPSGTFDGVTGEYTFSGELTAGLANWSVSRNGTVIGSDTGEYNCDDPGPGSGS